MVRSSRKIINLILMTAAFMIWIVFFYRIVFEENGEEDALPAKTHKERVEIYHSKKDNNYPVNEQRDPFVTPYNQYKSKPKPQVQKPVVQEEPVPKLRLLGTIDNKMAIIAFPDNSVKYLKVKQTENNITIVKIGKDNVSFEFNKKIYEVKN